MRCVTLWASPAMRTNLVFPARRSQRCLEPVSSAVPPLLQRSSEVIRRHAFYLKPGQKLRVKQALARKRNRKKTRAEGKRDPFAT